MLRMVYWVFLATVLAWGVAEVSLQIRQRLRSERTKTTEWRSFGVIAVAVAAGDFLAVFVARHLHVLHLPLSPGLFVAATVMIWIGAGFRLWAVRTLGQYFRAVVHIQEGHQVVRSGPYRYLRHPSYTGLMVALMGLGLVFANPVSWVIFVGCALLSMLYRIRVEERVLTKALGAEYTDYAAQTKRLVPGVW